MCITEKSTGFNWRKGDWEYTRFKEAKYIIEKLQPEDFTNKPETPIPKSGFCKSELKGKEDYFSDDSGHSYGCYNLHEFRGPFSVHKSQVCLETWKGRDTDRVLQGVSCEGGSDPIVFAPDGWFHHAHIHRQYDPTDDYKDSLYIEVGKCAVIGK